jgi:hypothetical protein
MDWTSALADISQNARNTADPTPAGKRRAPDTRQDDHNCKLISAQVVTNVGNWGAAVRVTMSSHRVRTR